MINRFLSGCALLLLSVSSLLVACQDDSNPPSALLPEDSGSGGGVLDGQGGAASLGGAGGLGGEGSGPAHVQESCETEECGPRRRCVQEEDGAFCTCLPGFGGQRCEDVDECAAAESPCGAHEVCRNYPGGFACTCAPGFIGEEGGCVDIDECAGEVGPCAAGGTCENTLGAFQCTCDEGTVGDGFFCKSEASCDDGPCSGNGTCVETPSGHACQCNPGFSGTTDCESVCETLDLPPALDEWVRLIIGKPQGTLVPQDVSSLESLNARSLGLTEVSGLACFPSLRQLDLAANQLESADLAVVAQLNRLESLRLDCNPIGDLSALENHPTLEHLWFSQSGPGCEASLDDISALASLRRLRSLDLSGHDLLDLEALIELDALRSLSLSRNAINAQDLEALGTVTALETLMIRGNPVGAPHFLQGMKHLKVLDLSATDVGDLSPVAWASSLEAFAGAQLELSDISSLPHLERLAELDLSQNEISDVSSLTQFERLHFLDLRHNEVENLTSFLKMSALGTLLIDDNPALCDEALWGDAENDYQSLVHAGLWLGATCSAAP